MTVQQYQNHQKRPSANAVFNLRMEAGLTQMELSRLSGVPQKTIARIEQGANTTVGTLEKLTDVLNFKLNITFLPDEQPPEPLKPKEED